MKRRLIFEVEEGDTKRCEFCPFWSWNEGRINSICDKPNDISCEKYNLSTLKFIGEDA